MSHLTVFYDADCPVCSREISFLRKRTAEEAVAYIAIQDPAFERLSLGLSKEIAMGAMQGLLPDGTRIEGVEVFRRLYAAAGFGFLVPVSRLPGVSGLLDFGYKIFAKNRVKLFGRCGPSGCERPEDSTPPRT